MHVVDTSVVTKWFVAEPNKAAAEALIGQPLIAPDLLLIEIGNVGWKKRRLGQMATEQALLAASVVRSFVELTSTRLFAETALAIAIELDHAIYDCYFLALAEAMDLPLITADTKFVQHCAASRFAPHFLPLEAWR